MASRDSFLSRAYTAARMAGLGDAQARLAASQAALESGFGRRAPGNNYFGIKAGKGWKGQRQTFRTWEVENGVKVPKNAQFRAYSTPEESFTDWQRTVGRRWPGALTAETFPAAASALRPGLPGGYATDPNYASKLGRINSFMTNMGLGQEFDVPRPTPRPDLAAAPMLNSAPRPSNVAGAYSQYGSTLDQMGVRLDGTPSRYSDPQVSSPMGTGAPMYSGAPVGAVQRGPLGPASLPPDRPMPSGPRFSAPTPASAPAAGPSLSTPGQALAYGQLGGTMALAGIRNLDGTPAANVSLPPDRPMPTGPITPPSPNLVSNLPTASVVPTISPVAPPTQVAPVYTPPRTVAPMQESSFPAAPPAPTRPSISDVYAGMPGTAISNAGIEVSRAPGGFIDRYNPQFDVTTVETPQGYQAATLGKGRLSRTDQARSLLGNKQLSDKAKRGLGTVLGGLLGGAVAGPLGGMLGGVVGNRIAGGGVLGGVLGYGANYFPDAPTRPDASWGPGMSDGDLRSYAGDRVADAVKAGRAGLY